MSCYWCTLHLSLNDGGIATYSGGSGTNALTFSIHGWRQSITPFRPYRSPQVNLPNGATITDGAGNAANLAGAAATFVGLQIDTTVQPWLRLSESPASGDLNAGQTVTLTLNLSEAVTVAGGTPTLTLNDGGTATYTGGSGTNALTFSYTVGAGQNTPRTRRHRRQSQLRYHHRRRRQCRQPLAHRSHPERTADRHHHADDVIG